MSRRSRLDRPERAERIFRQLDADGSGVLERPELHAHVMASAGVDKAMAERVFAAFDADGSGAIEHAELSGLLREALGELAASLNAEEWGGLVADTLRRGDKDASGAWEVGEFEVRSPP